MMIRALLFDFDGTLADSFEAITASTNHVRAAFGLPALSEAKVRQFVGLGLTNLVQRLVPNADPAEAVGLYRSHHPEVMLTGTRLVPGALATLDALRSQGRRLGVCSNKSVHFTKQLVEGLGLSDHFGTVLGPEDVPRPKPAADMLLEGARRLEVSANETVYVGDMAIDVAAARAAGMPVWILSGGAADQATIDAAKPDRILSEFNQILQYI